MKPELRQDELGGEWTIVAPGRKAIGAARPAGLPPVDRARCPFCPGHEAETEATVLAIGEPWQVRVVANKFPLAEAHEVVIESRDHDGDLALYAPEHAAKVLGAVRDRVRALASRPDVRAVAAFRNRGRRAGSSQPHPHMQIVGLPMVPPGMARRIAIAERDPAVLARMIERELRERVRVIDERAGWIAWCPYASRRAWEVRIAPTSPTAPGMIAPRLVDLDDAALAALASHLVRTLARLRAVLGEHDYNVLVHEPPPGAAGSLAIDVLPRTGGDAGFELLTGTGVCVVAPEQAAAQLRSA